MMNQKIGLVVLFFIGCVFTASAQEPKMKKVFNGKNLKGWMLPDNNIWWSVDDGILTAKSGPEKTGNIIWTDKSYKDFIIETDFKYGEGVVDTGIFLRNEDQQIQMGISGSLKRDMTGSPYIPGKGYPQEAEGVADVLKRKEWNTIKVKAVANVYTVWINGTEVLNFESADVPEEGPIGLQLHPGNEMEASFRNIRVGEVK